MPIRLGNPGLESPLPGLGFARCGEGADPGSLGLALIGILVAAELLVLLLLCRRRRKAVRGRPSPQSRRR
ncbi:MULTISPECIES: hypothetical protein [Inquilinus]|uniref:Uncharacterized protein n=1 Tax=Inquilinus ginsengisoli TaxID=363840 RepID=A0ABU1JVK9_9PROT|nr:hypothetical protein [Inquilinus ginsengisoli]MDR6292648.1 hypothetical protein [Inquilinus ginsengisoli]